MLPQPQPITISPCPLSLWGQRLKSTHPWDLPKISPKSAWGWKFHLENTRNGLGAGFNHILDTPLYMSSMHHSSPSHSHGSHHAPLPPITYEMRLGNFINSTCFSSSGIDRQSYEFCNKTLHNKIISVRRCHFKYYLSLCKNIQKTFKYCLSE